MREKLACGLVSGVVLDELPTDGQVEHLGLELREQAVEVRPVSLDPVDECQVFVERVDDAALLGEGREGENEVRYITEINFESMGSAADFNFFDPCETNGRINA